MFENLLNKFTQISDVEYHTGPGIGSSMLKTAQISMAHYKARHVDGYEQPQTEALHIGKLVHKAILEGQDFKSRYVVMPKFTGLTLKGEMSENSKEAKEKRKAWLSDQPPEAIIVDEQERDMIIGMIQAILDHPIAKGLLTDGQAEMSGYVIDKETDQLLKIRPDFIRQDGILVDYKTTKDASPKWWPRDAAKLGYHIQAGYYRKIANQILGINDQRFAFIAQEKVAPYAVTVHVADPAFLERGEQIAWHLLRKIKACKDTGVYPGYCDQALSLSLPDWAMKDDEEVLL